MATDDYYIICYNVTLYFGAHHVVASHIDSPIEKITVNVVVVVVVVKGVASGKDGIKTI